jgi:hypothetical protein
VHFPAFLWGVGTAIGELPPYFVARAARFSEEDPDDEDLEEFHESLKDEGTSLLSRAKVRHDGCRVTMAVPCPLPFL